MQHGPKALKLISDSELLVRQIKGIYKVKNAILQDLHARAKELIAQLDWFSIGHALREHNQEADRLANEAMDRGMGQEVWRGPRLWHDTASARSSKDLRGRKIEISGCTLPDAQHEFRVVQKREDVEDY